MDSNKLQVLRAAGYVVNKCCGLCTHARFTSASPWGTCAMLPYRHGTHTEARQASIHAYGSCDTDFKPSEERVAKLAPSGFEQFVDRRAFTRANRHKQRTSY